ncbi:MAG: base excision DNA repair protein, partial [Acidithiobacillus sp.]
IMDRLQQLPGIGRWSAEYVLLRALGRLEVFPGDDVGGRNGLFRWLDRDPRRASYEETLAQVAPWSPYAGMVYFLMLLRRLEADGHIPPQEPSVH